MDVEVLAVYRNPQVVRDPGVLASGLLYGTFNCRQHDFAAYPALALDVRHHRLKITVRGHNFRSYLMSKNRTTSR